MSILFNENPLVVNTKLAKNIGLNEAIFLQQLHQKPIAYYPIYRQITGTTTDCKCSKSCKD